MFPAYSVSAISASWALALLTLGLAIGFLSALLLARFKHGAWFLEATLRTLSAIIRSPKKAVVAFRMWRENWNRRKLQSAALEKQIDVLEDEIDSLEEQIQERRNKIGEARWLTRKP